MKRYTFDVQRSEEYGELGFRPSWYPTGDPLPVMTVAHDILEHFPKDDGSAEGEYMALGAALLLRGDSGYCQNGRPEQNIATDIPTIWGVQASVRPCGPIRDRELRATIDRILFHYREELAYYNQDAGGQPTASDLEHIGRWIAKGYNRAKRRYRERASEIAWSLFKPIQEEADKALEHAEEGMRLTVWVDFTRLRVRTDYDYPNN